MTYINFENQNIGIKGKYIYINRLESHGEVGVIVQHLNWHFNNPEAKRLSINISHHSNLYTNLIVPLCAVFYYLKSIGKIITLHTDSEHIKKMCLLKPELASVDNLDKSSRILDKIWKIENEYHLINMVQFFRRFLGARLGFETTMLNVLELAIIEALENALIHSESNCCLIMGQLQRNKNYFSLCVSDTGVGVRKSLEAGGYNYDSEIEFLAASLKKGVTSKHQENYGGNGLYCLSRLAKINQGHFTLWSGESSVVVDGKTDDDRLYEYLPKIDFLPPCNHIDFQIPLNENFSADYDDFDFSTDDSDGDITNEEGFNTLIISELESGYCTRSAGNKALNIVLKFLDLPLVVGIIIDFNGIPICSTSFIDSFIGILYKTIGESQFNERIRISNATYEIRKAIYAVTKKR